MFFSEIKNSISGMYQESEFACGIKTGSKQVLSLQNSSEYNRLYAFVRRNIALNAFRHIILRKLSDDGSGRWVFLVDVTRGVSYRIRS